MRETARNSGKIDDKGGIQNEAEAEMQKTRRFINPDRPSCFRTNRKFDRERSLIVRAELTRNGRDKNAKTEVILSDNFKTASKLRYSASNKSSFLTLFPFLRLSSSRSFASFSFERFSVRLHFAVNVPGSEKPKMHYRPLEKLQMFFTLSCTCVIYTKGGINECKEAELDEINGREVGAKKD